MKNGTCIVFVLFHIFRHYKRIGETSKRKDLISDFKKCHLLLERMAKNAPLDISSELVQELIIKINGLGSDIKLKHPLRYVDNFDRDVIAIMIRLTSEIIDFAKRPFYRRHSGEIFTRLLVLHNLPRVLLDDSSGDSSTLRNFHLSKQEAIECVLANLGDEWLNKGKVILGQGNNIPF